MPEDYPRFDTRSTSVVLRVLVGIVLLAGLLWLAGAQFLPGLGAYAYALKYHVTMDRAHFAPKPKDCDWSQPPIGNKSCHYQIRVVLKAVLRTSTGQDMDEDLDEEQYKQAVAARGPYDLPGPVPVVKDVFVDWVKIEEH